MDFNMMINRVIRAAMLDVDLYEEVEADSSLNTEALAIVIIISLISGIGTALGQLFGEAGMGGFIMTLILTPIFAVIGYLVWAVVAMLVGTNFFGGTTDFGEMRRVLGYAYGPNILGVFGFIPVVGGLVSLAGGIWALVTGVVAIRQAMDFDTGKAVVTVIIGWIAMFLIIMIPSCLFGGMVGLLGSAAGG